jgi:hypothetical protein
MASVPFEYQLKQNSRRAGCRDYEAGQGNNYGDKTVGARENDLLRICFFLKKENNHESRESH